MPGKLTSEPLLPAGNSRPDTDESEPVPRSRQEPVTLSAVDAAPARDHGARRHGATLWIALLLALVVRSWGIGVQSFSMDEMTEFAAVQQGLGAVVTAADGFPPLYAVLLHWWLEIAGTPEAARWLSVLIGVLAIPVIYRLGAILGGPRVGELSALLLAISPIHIWYSQEARAYGLFFLLALAALWRYEVARSTDRTADWVWYAAAMIAGLYTHYYFAFVILAIAVAELVPARRPSRIRRWLQVHVATIPFVLPLLLLMGNDLKAQVEWIATERSLDLSTLGYTLFTYLSGFSLGPSLRELHTARLQEAVRHALPWVLPAALATAYLLLEGWRWKEGRSAWYRVATWMAVTILAAGAMSAAFDLGYRVRYVAWCAGLLVILLAMGVVGGRRRWATGTALGIIVLVSLAATLNRHTVGRYMNEDARGAARMIASLPETGAPVFVVSGYMAGPIDYYLRGARRLTPLSNAETRVSPDPALEIIRETVGAGKTFWFLYSRPFDGDPQGRLYQALERQARLQLTGEVPGIRFYRGTGW